MNHNTDTHQNIITWVAKTWNHTPRPSAKDQMMCAVAGKHYHQSSVRVHRFIIKCAEGQTPCYEEASRALAVATNRLSEHRDLFQLSTNMSGDFLLDTPEGNQSLRAKDAFLAELDSLVGRRQKKESSL